MPAVTRAAAAPRPRSSDMHRPATAPHDRPAALVRRCGRASIRRSAHRLWTVRAPHRWRTVVGGHFGTIARWACVTKKKRAQIWARFLGKGRKPEWPALIFADSQVISAAGSGSKYLARRMLNPATEFRASRQPSLARPVRSRISSPSASTDKNGITIAGTNGPSDQIPFVLVNGMYFMRKFPLFRS